MSKSAARRLRDPAPARDPKYTSGKASKNSSEERSQPDRELRGALGVYGMMHRSMTLAQQKEARQKIRDSRPPSRDTSAERRSVTQRRRKDRRGRPKASDKAVPRNKSGARSHTNEAAQSTTAAPAGSAPRPPPSRHAAVQTPSESGIAVSSLIEPLVVPRGGSPTPSAATDDLLPPYPPLESDFETMSEYDIQDMSSDGDHDASSGVDEDENEPRDLSVVFEGVDMENEDDEDGEEELAVQKVLLDSFYTRSGDDNLDSPAQ